MDQDLGEEPPPTWVLDPVADTPPTGVLIDPTLDVQDEPDLDPTPAPAKKGLRSLIEWGVVIGVALIVALGIRTWVFQPFWIPSGSMETTLDIGDRVLVNKLSYHLHGFHRGDVVVFKQPTPEDVDGDGQPDTWLLDDDIKDLIKRVIGLPGDTVTIQGCSVYIDGRKLVEPYTDGQCTDPAERVVDPDQDGTFVVPPKRLFVMGDNRGGSQDSRFHGFVPESDVVGRAFVVIWPKGHWRWL